MQGLKPNLGDEAWVKERLKDRIKNEDTLAEAIGYASSYFNTSKYKLGLSPEKIRYVLMNFYRNEIQPYPDKHESYVKDDDINFSKIWVDAYKQLKITPEENTKMMIALSNEQEEDALQQQLSSSSVSSENAKSSSMATVPSHPYANWKSWSDVDWRVVYDNEKYNKSTKITLDSTGEFVERIETIDDGKSQTQIYSNGKLIMELDEPMINCYYNNDGIRSEINSGKEKISFLGEATPLARQYHEKLARKTFPFDVLQSGTDGKFDFKGKEWLNSHPNSLVKLGNHIMTARDAGNFLYGYTMRNKHNPDFIAWGAGMHEKVKDIDNSKDVIDFIKNLPNVDYPYLGEARLSANMNYLGFGLFEAK